MKRFAAVLISTVLLTSATVHAEPATSAQSAVLIEATSGTVIYEKNAHEMRPMASTTKIMTALVALEKSDLTKTVTISEKAVGVEGSSIYLYRNEKLSMEDLVYALMLESANDAAAAIAVELAGGIDEFADMMNSKASELELNSTHFTNPHGLDNSEHYTTAYDLARLAAYSMNNEQFCKIVSTYKRVIPLKESEGARLLLNHNKLIKRYDGAIGVKTGFTKKSGRCLVSAAERDGVRFIAVTLNAPDDWNDHAAMLDYGFSKYERILLSESGGNGFVMPVVDGNISYIQCHSSAEVYAVLPKDKINITQVTELDRFFYAPIKAGEMLGRILYYNNGEIVAEVPITADFDVELVEQRFNFFDWLKGLIG